MTTTDVEADTDMDGPTDDARDPSGGPRRHAAGGAATDWRVALLAAATLAALLAPGGAAAAGAGGGGATPGGPTAGGGPVAWAGAAPHDGGVAGLAPLVGGGERRGGVALGHNNSSVGVAVLVLGDRGQYNRSLLPADHRHINRSWRPPESVAGALDLPAARANETVWHGRPFTMWSRDWDVGVPSINTTAPPPTETAGGDTTFNESVYDHFFGDGLQFGENATETGANNYTVPADDFITDPASVPGAENTTGHPGWEALREGRATAGEFRLRDGDVASPRPPLAAARWNLLQVAGAPRVGQNRRAYWFGVARLPDAQTAVAPAAANATATANGSVIRDAHLGIHSITPHTYLHVAENETRKLIAPNSTVVAEWDTRVAVPERPPGAVVHQVRACTNGLRNISLWRNETLLATGNRTAANVTPPAPWPQSHRVALGPASEAYRVAPDPDRYPDLDHRNHTMAEGPLRLTAVANASVRDLAIRGNRTYVRTVTYYNDTVEVPADSETAETTDWDRGADASGWSGATGTTTTTRTVPLGDRWARAPATNVTLNQSVVGADGTTRSTPVGWVPCGGTVRVDARAVNYPSTFNDTRRVLLENSTDDTARVRIARRVVEWNITAAASADHEWHNDSVDLSVTARDWEVPEIATRVRAVETERGDVRAVVVRNETSGPVDRLEVAGGVGAAALADRESRTLHNRWNYYTTRNATWDRVVADTAAGPVVVRPDSRALTLDAAHRPAEVHGFPSRPRAGFEPDVFDPAPGTATRGTGPLAPGEWRPVPNLSARINVSPVFYGYSEPRALHGRLPALGGETTDPIAFAPVLGHWRRVENVTVVERVEPEIRATVRSHNGTHATVRVRVTTPGGAPVATDRGPREGATLRVGTATADTNASGVAVATTRITNHAPIRITYAPAEDDLAVARAAAAETAGGRAFGERVRLEQTTASVETPPDTAPVAGIVAAVGTAVPKLAPLVAVLYIVGRVFNVRLIPFRWR